MLNYNEGEIIKISLKQSVPVFGLIARMNNEGAVFMYFSLSKDFCEDSIIFAGFCSDLSILNEDWEIVGKYEGWKRGDWPVLPLIQIEEREGLGCIRSYDDASFEIISEDRRPLTDIRQKYYPDGFMGSGFVESKLQRIVDLEA
jgi:hypothetical protein